MRDGPGISIIFLIFLVIGIIGMVICISGCVENGVNQSVNTSQKTEPAYVKNTVVCPNPECPLHNPNKKVDIGQSGVGGQPLRPIDMEMSPTGACYYLCQVCGERW